MDPFRRNISPNLKPNFGGSEFKGKKICKVVATGDENEFAVLGNGARAKPHDLKQEAKKNGNPKCYPNTSGVLKKKILAERKESKLPVSSSLTPQSNLVLDPDAKGAAFRISPPCLHFYDPITNYTSPRPKFLRYNPSLRTQLLQRIEGGKKAAEEVRSSSSANESDDESDCEEEEVEKKKSSYSCLGWSLLIKFGILMMIVCCISIGSSPFEGYEISGGNDQKSQSNLNSILTKNVVDSMSLSQMCPLKRESTCNLEEWDIFSLILDRMAEGIRSELSHKTESLKNVLVGSMRLSQMCRIIIRESTCNLEEFVIFPLRLDRMDEGIRNQLSHKSEDIKNGALLNSVAEKDERVSPLFTEEVHATESEESSNSCPNVEPLDAFYVNSKPNETFNLTYQQEIDQGYSIDTFDVFSLSLDQMGEGIRIELSHKPEALKNRSLLNSVAEKDERVSPPFIVEGFATESEESHNSCPNVESLDTYYENLESNESFSLTYHRETDHGYLEPVRIFKNLLDESICLFFILFSFSAMVGVLSCCFQRYLRRPRSISWFAAQSPSSSELDLREETREKIVTILPTPEEKASNQLNDVIVPLEHSKIELKRETVFGPPSVKLLGEFSLTDASVYNDGFGSKMKQRRKTNTLTSSSDTLKSSSSVESISRNFSSKVEDEGNASGARPTPLRRSRRLQNRWHE